MGNRPALGKPASVGKPALGGLGGGTNNLTVNPDHRCATGNFFNVMLVTMPIFQDGSQGFLVARILPQDTPLSPMPPFTGNTVAVDRAAGRWSFRRFTLRRGDIQTIPFSLPRIKLAAIE